MDFVRNDRYLNKLYNFISGMAMKRIHFVPVKTEDNSYNITCDIFVDDVGRPSNKMASFGVIGGFKEGSDVIYPFILRPNGKIDFGTAYEEDAERHGKTNLLDGRDLAIGELFTFEYDGDVFTYKLAKIVDAQ